MDTLKKVVGKDEQSKAPEASSGGQQEDIGDKSAEYINKKYMGDKLSADQRQKVTEAGRQGIEKATGQKVPEKPSEQSTR
ncbi:hypothetical protein F5Y12DRAFT_177861 [Xylaria sp. FL1777]|nr:hypothetical protein F5Y12DRAFT_177861 [Xylaria sp. FL1777]